MFGEDMVNDSLGIYDNNNIDYSNAFAPQQENNTPSFTYGYEFEVNPGFFPAVTIMSVDDDDDDDAKDADWTDDEKLPRVVSKKTKNPSTTLKINNKRTRGRPNLTDEEKEENKKRRTEETKQLGVLKSMIAAGLDPVSATLKQEPVISEAATQLMTTVLGQQDHIAQINNHIIVTGMEHLNSLSEVERHHREERDCLQNVINHVRQEVAERDATIIKMGLEYKNAQYEALRQQEVEAKLRVEIAAAGEREARLREQIVTMGVEHKLVMEEFAREREQAKAVEVQPRVELITKERALQPTRMSPPLVGRLAIKQEMVPTTLYTWSAIDMESPKCLEVYGFAATQIRSLYACVKRLTHKAEDSDKGKKGCKTVVSQETRFLVFLYFFARYTTMKTMQETFQMSSSHIQSNLLELITSVANNLFVASKECGVAAATTTTRVYRRYFFAVNKPQDPAIARDYYCVHAKTYGVYLHCLHHESAHNKVTDFYISSQRGVVPEFLDGFIVVEEEDEQHMYEERMKSKFNIAVSKYRGNLGELPDVIRCALALTNFDIEYGNPVCAHATIRLDIKSEDSLL